MQAKQEKFVPSGTRKSRPELDFGLYDRVCATILLTLKTLESGNLILLGVGFDGNTHRILNLFFQAHDFTMEMQAGLVLAAKIFENEADFGSFREHKIRLEEDAARRDIAHAGDTFIAALHPGWLHKRAL